MLSKDSKRYVAGHHGLVGSAIWNNLLQRGYTNLVGRSHKELDLTDQVAVKKFFDEDFIGNFDKCREIDENELNHIIMQRVANNVNEYMFNEYSDEDGRVPLWDEDNAWDYFDDDFCGYLDQDYDGDFAKFCEENGFRRQHLVDNLHGRASYCKGWVFRILKPEERMENVPESVAAKPIEGQISLCNKLYKLKYVSKVLP